MGQAPDVAFGVLNAATTLALVAAGGRDRVQNMPWLPLALGRKAGMDAAYALYLTAEQASKHRKTFCFFCIPRPRRWRRSPRCCPMPGPPLLLFASNSGTARG
jgi:hypothetical protein